MIQTKPRGYFGAGVTQRQADLLNTALDQLTAAGVAFNEMQANSGYERYIHSDDQVVDKLKSKFAVHYCDTAVENRGHWYLIELGPKTTLEVSQQKGVEGCIYKDGKFLFTGELFTNQSVRQRKNFYKECAVFNVI